MSLSRRLRQSQQVLSSLVLLMSACSVQSRGSFDQSQQAPDLIYAEAWDSMTIVVGRARTQLENNGHFTTVPNACYRRESGALELELWNQVATLTNRLLQQQWLEEVTCQPRPAESPDLYQPLVVKLLNEQTRELLSTQGSKFCTQSADLDSASRLLVLVGQVAQRAYHEGCAPVD